MDTYEKIVEVRWADVDQNMHVRHSVYYDYGAYVRIRFFTEAGFGAGEMAKLKIGPILFKEECSFIREIRPDDVIRINLLKGVVAEDGSRWILHHEIFNQDDVKAAHITIKGAWIDTETRKLTAPPAGLAESVATLAVGEDYVYKKK